MFNAANDIRYAHDHRDELLRLAEQYRLRQSGQPQQPNLFNQLQSKLVVWIDMARPQRSSDQPAQPMNVTHPLA